MTADITIRRYDEPDLAGVIAVARDLQAHEKAIEPLVRPPGDIDADYVAKRLHDCRLHEGAMFVAVRDGDIVGYVTAEAQVASDDPDEIPHDYAYIADLGVLADARGRGIGDQLMAVAENFVREGGATRLRLYVLGGNEGARRFYDRAGFSARVLELEKLLD